MASVPRDQQQQLRNRSGKISGTREAQVSPQEGESREEAGDEGKADGDLLQRQLSDAAGDQQRVPSGNEQEIEDPFRNTFRNLKGHYGIDVPHRVAWNFLAASFFFWASYGVWRYGPKLTEGVRAALSPAVPSLHPLVPFGLTSLLLLGLFFYFLCYFLTLMASLHTSLIQRRKISRQMVNTVSNWPEVRRVLDLACGRGVLLASIALRLEKEKRGGRVVGYDHWAAHGDKGRFDAGSMAWTLKCTAAEGVGETVTCKSGPLGKLPFADQYFDHVLSALNFSTATAHETGSWEQALREVGRVIKSKGKLIIWDLRNVRSYGTFLEEEGKWTDVQIIPGATAFLERTKYLVATRK